jgi:hypothetical protein
MKFEEQCTRKEKLQIPQTPSLQASLVVLYYEGRCDGNKTQSHKTESTLQERLHCV